MHHPANTAFRALAGIAAEVVARAPYFPPVTVPAGSPDYFREQIEAIDREAIATAKVILAESPTVPELWKRVAAHERAGEWGLMDVNTRLAQQLSLDARLAAVEIMLDGPHRVPNFQFFLNHYVRLLTAQAMARKAVRV